jgi:hypothetical protein
VSDDESDLEETGTEEAETGTGAGEAVVEQVATAPALQTQEDSGNWEEIEMIQETHLVSGTMISLQVPYDVFDNDQKFCWLAEARNRNSAFTLRPPTDDLPNEEDLRLTRFELVTPTGEISTTAEVVIETNNLNQNNSN